MHKKASRRILASASARDAVWRECRPMGVEKRRILSAQDDTAGSVSKVLRGRKKISVTSCSSVMELGIMEEFDAVRQRFSRISGALNERLRRLFAATEAEVLGDGGISLVARATGVSRRAITEGLAELGRGVSCVPEKTPERIRRPGGRT